MSHSHTTRDLIGETYYKEGARGEILYEVLRSENAHKLMMVTNWRRNRPADSARVEEIVRDISARGLCDGELLLAMIPSVGCVCYDGNHRLEASRRCFPRGGLRMRIVLNVTETEVETEFIRINKGVPVPELYFSDEETDTYLRDRIREFMEAFIRDSRVKEHASTSTHPKRPNFNKDILFQQISEYVEHYFRITAGLTRADIHKIITADVLMSWFNDMNEVARAKIEISCQTNKMIEKCVKSGWYLFYFDWKTQLASDVCLYIPASRHS